MWRREREGDKKLESERGEEEREAEENKAAGKRRNMKINIDISRFGDWEVRAAN